MDFVREYRGLYRTLAYDCSEDREVCPLDVLESLPLITAYYNKGVNPYTGRVVVEPANFEGEMNPVAVSKFMGSRMPYFGENVTGGTIDEFIAKPGTKALLFTNKKRPSAIFKAITSRYRDRISFGMVPQDDNELLDKYEPARMPALCVLTDSDPIWFSGEYTIASLSEFLDPLAPTAKLEKPVITAATEYEKDLEIIDQVVKLHPRNFEKEVTQRDKVAYVHFYSEDHQDEVWEEMAEKYKSTVLLGSFNCDEEEDWYFAKELGIQKLPTIRVFPQDKNENSFTLSWKNKQELHGKMNESMVFQIASINDDDPVPFIRSTLKSNKLGILLTTGLNIPLEIFSLASNPAIKKHVYFCIWKGGTSKDFRKDYGLGYPSLIGFWGVKGNADSMTYAEYKGSHSDYPQMQAWVIDLISNVYQPPVEVTDAEVAAETLDEFTHTTFMENCNKSWQPCFIYLTNGTIDGKKNAKHLEKIKRAKIESRKKGYLAKFGHIDGLCQEEIRSQYVNKEEKLPAFVVFHGRKNRGSVLSEELTSDNLSGFIDADHKGSMILYEMGDIRVINRDCKDFHAKPQGGSKKIFKKRKNQSGEEELDAQEEQEAKEAKEEL